MLTLTSVSMSCFWTFILRLNEGWKTFFVMMTSCQNCQTIILCMMKWGIWVDFNNTDTNDDEDDGYASTYNI